MLALSAGLLTVYTVNWTLSLFIGFITVWLLFTVVVFFIISVRLAAKIETIYIDCTVGLNIPKEQTKAAIKQLEINAEKQGVEMFSMGDNFRQSREFCLIPRRTSGNSSLFFISKSKHREYACCPEMGTHLLCNHKNQLFRSSIVCGSCY